MNSNDGSGTDRRRFLKGAAAGTWGLAAAEPPLSAVSAAALPALRTSQPAAEYMADAARALGVGLLAGGPDFSFANVLACANEESAVAMAHGYSKPEGRPTMALLRGEAGILRAAPAIHHALLDRAPVLLLAEMDAPESRLDLDGLIRSMTKWDDRVASPGEFGRSLRRAYSVAMTAPGGPVLIASNIHPRTGTEGIVSPPAVAAPRVGDTAAVAEAARMLVDAERPRIITGRYAGTRNAIDLLVALADVLQAPVECRGPLRFPNRHRLAGNGGTGYVPDVALCLDVEEFPQDGNVIRLGPFVSEDARAALDIVADVEATLPDLIEAIKQRITAARGSALADRGMRLAAGHRRERESNIAIARARWDAGTVNMARVAAELWRLIENEDWSLVSPSGSADNWPRRLWEMKLPHHDVGGLAGKGSGYSVSLGAALANRGYGRVSIGIHTAHDIRSAPGALETAARYGIPLLTIAASDDETHGDCVPMAQACGAYAEGPITEARDLPVAFRRGIERVRKGEPALIHVVGASLPS